MAGGHTHIQMYRQFNGKLIINPGSVGMPFKKFVNGNFPEVLSYAEFAVLEIENQQSSVSLMRIPLNKEILQKKAFAWENPMSKYLYELYT